MKILIAPAHYLLSDKYGSEPLWAYEIVEHLAKEVNSLDVICGVIDIKKPLPKNVNLVPIYKDRSGNVYFEFLKRILFYPLVFLAFLKLNSKNHYTVVHHLFPLSIATLNPIIFLGKLFGVKKIVLGPLQLPQTTFSRKDLKLVLVGNSRNDWSGYLIVPIYLLIILIIKPLTRLMFNVADVVICNSKASEKYYKDTEGLNNLEVVSTGITMREALPKEYKTKALILCVGQLTKRKGQDLILEAFYQLTEKYGKGRLSLTLVGSGELKEKLIQFVEEKKLKDVVHFYPAVSHDKIWQFYEKATIYCLPSRSDPSPTVLLEAMMSGLAIVATDVGAVSEMVDDAGLLVPTNDAGSIEKGLEKLLLSPHLINEYARIGRIRIENRYSWEKIVKRYITIYEKKI